MVDDNKVVYVAYATDSNYIVPTCVSMFSLAKNACDSRIYEIYVIVPEKVSEYERDQLRLSISGHENVTVNIVTADLLNVETTIPHISNVTYYKCYLMRYLPDTVNKCVWLDSDTVVSGDIGEVFDFDMQDDYLGGVPSYGLVNSWIFSEKILLKEKTHYFNAGVLLVNLSKMREDKLDVVMNRLVSLRYPTQDQDVMNIACHGRKRVLPMKYNFQPIRLAQQGVSILEQFERSEISEAMRNPVVVHFLTSEKPWDMLQYDYRLLWRKCYFELLKIVSQFSGNSAIDSKERYCDLTYSAIETAETIAFYGAGLRCIKTLGVCNVFDLRKPDVIWDKNAENIRDVYGFAVNNPYENTAILNSEQTLVIICNDNPTALHDIKESLELKGFSFVYSAAEYTLALWEKGLSGH